MKNLFSYEGKRCLITGCFSGMGEATAQVVRSLGGSVVAVDIKKPTTFEPEAFYDALHHAREPLSMETTILFMEELLTGYGKDPEATFIVNERELYFVPCVNPDGYEYNRRIRPGGGGLWRKKRLLEIESGVQAITVLKLEANN